MNQIIKIYLKTAPDEPGVYKMLDISKTVLYVGKAKNLKRRLSNYLKPLSNRLQCMVAQVNSVETTITNNETEALLLESQLIKSLQPKYNIILKDDKSYPYILLDKHHEFPRLTKYRGKYQQGCHGPFLSADKLQDTISTLHKIFLLRSCSDFTFKTRKRPCLEYYIKRCSAPCVNKISHANYNIIAQQAQNVLLGKKNNVKNELIQSMKDASHNLNYERAAIYRDNIRSLQYININQHHIPEGDVISIYQENDKSHVQILRFDNNIIKDQYSYTIHNTEHVLEQEITDKFIMQFYHHWVPKNIFSNYQVSTLTIEAIKSLSTHTVNFYHPKRGEKFKLLQSMYNNIHQYLCYNNFKQHLKNIQNTFQLPAIPMRIEIYDNSHTSGNQPIGVMVVVDNKHGFNKKEYKIFNINNGNTSDDYSMMREVLSRRLQKLNEQNKPDFILIDGGKGHLSAIQDILGDIPFACMSKGKQRNAGNEYFHTLEKGSFQITSDNKLLHCLQIMRDEAHRFAISTHRKKRNKTTNQSILDNIPNIGQQRKKLLLTHFKSVQAIQQSSVDQLATIKGINKKLAKSILEYCNHNTDK